MKISVKFLVLLFLCSFNFSTKILAQSPCEACMIAEGFLAENLVNNYRYNIASITPLWGEDSDSYIGGAFANDFSHGLDSMSWIISAWEGLRGTPGFGTIVLSNDLLGASNVYWSQMANLKISFQYDMAVMDRDFCNCLQSRGCANGCP